MNKPLRNRTILNKNSETMIEMIKVSKIYPPDFVALKDVSISISSGEMFFIIGMSGAGKTTLLKLLCCMESPSNGLIEKRLQAGLIFPLTGRGQRLNPGECGPGPHRFRK